MVVSRGVSNGNGGRRPGHSLFSDLGIYYDMIIDIFYSMERSYDVGASEIKPPPAENSAPAPARKRKIIRAKFFHVFYYWRILSVVLGFSTKYNTISSNGGCFAFKVSSSRQTTYNLLKRKSKTEEKLQEDNTDRVDRSSDIESYGLEVPQNDFDLPGSPNQRFYKTLETPGQLPPISPLQRNIQVPALGLCFQSSSFSNPTPTKKKRANDKDSRSSGSSESSPRSSEECSREERDEDGYFLEVTKEKPRRRDAVRLELVGRSLAPIRPPKSSPTVITSPLNFPPMAEGIQSLVVGKKKGSRTGGGGRAFRRNNRQARIDKNNSNKNWSQCAESIHARESNVGSSPHSQSSGSGKFSTPGDLLSMEQQQFHVSFSNNQRSSYAMRHPGFNAMQHDGSGATSHHGSSPTSDQGVGATSHHGSSATSHQGVDATSRHDFSASSHQGFSAVGQPLLSMTGIQEFVGYGDARHGAMQEEAKDVTGRTHLSHEEYGGPQKPHAPFPKHGRFSMPKIAMPMPGSSVGSMPSMEDFKDPEDKEMDAVAPPFTPQQEVRLFQIDEVSKDGDGDNSVRGDDLSGSSRLTGNNATPETAPRLDVVRSRRASGTRHASSLPYDEPTSYGAQRLSHPKKQREAAVRMCFQEMGGQDGGDETSSKRGGMANPHESFAATSPLNSIPTLSTTEHGMPAQQTPNKTVVLSKKGSSSFLNAAVPTEIEFPSRSNKGPSSGGCGEIMNVNAKPFIPNQPLAPIPEEKKRLTFRSTLLSANSLQFSPSSNSSSSEEGSESDVSQQASRQEDRKATMSSLQVISNDGIAVRRVSERVVGASLGVQRLGSFSGIPAVCGVDANDCVVDAKTRRDFRRACSDHVKFEPVQASYIMSHDTASQQSTRPDLLTTNEGQNSSKTRRGELPFSSEEVQVLLKDVGDEVQSNNFNEIEFSMNASKKSHNLRKIQSQSMRCPMLSHAGAVDDENDFLLRPRGKFGRLVDNHDLPDDESYPLQMSSCSRERVADNVTTTHSGFGRDHAPKRHRRDVDGISFVKTQGEGNYSKEVPHGGRVGSSSDSSHCTTTGYTHGGHTTCMSTSKPRSSSSHFGHQQVDSDGPDVLQDIPLLQPRYSQDTVSHHDTVRTGDHLREGFEDPIQQVSRRRGLQDFLLSHEFWCSEPCRDSVSRRPKSSKLYSYTYYYDYSVSSDGDANPQQNAHADPVSSDRNANTQQNILREQQYSQNAMHFTRAPRGFRRESVSRSNFSKVYSYSRDSDARDTKANPLQEVRSHSESFAGEFSRSAESNCVESLGSCEFVSHEHSGLVSCDSKNADLRQKSRGQQNFPNVSNEAGSDENILMPMCDAVKHVQGRISECRLPPALSSGAASRSENSEDVASGDNRCVGTGRKLEGPRSATTSARAHPDAAGMAIDTEGPSPHSTSLDVTVTRLIDEKPLAVVFKADRCEGSPIERTAEPSEQPSKRVDFAPPRVDTQSTSKLSRKSSTRFLVSRLLASDVADETAAKALVTPALGHDGDAEEAALQPQSPSSESESRVMRKLKFGRVLGKPPQPRLKAQDDSAVSISGPLLRGTASSEVQLSETVISPSPTTGCEGLVVIPKSKKKEKTVVEPSPRPPVPEPEEDESIFLGPAALGGAVVAAITSVVLAVLCISKGGAESDVAVDGSGVNVQPSEGVLGTVLGLFASGSSDPPCSYRTSDSSAEREYYAGLGYFDDMPTDHYASRYEGDESLQVLASAAILSPLECHLTLKFDAKSPIFHYHSDDGLLIPIFHGFTIISLT